MESLGTIATARDDETEPRGRRPGRPPAGPLVALVALVLAGVLHVAAAVEHRGTSELVVAFFLLVALAQLAAAAWLAVAAATRRPPRAWPAAAVLAGTVALVGLYLVAHTTDVLTGLTSPGAGAGLVGHDHDVPASGPVPLGHAPAGTGELPGLLGSATVVSELVAMMALLGLLPPASRRRATDAILVLGASAWVLWWTGVLA